MAMVNALGFLNDLGVPVEDAAQLLIISMQPNHPICPQKVPQDARPAHPE